MIDLKPFCLDDESRYGICAPFKRGEYIYATDGRIIICVPSNGEDVTGNEGALSEKGIKEVMAGDYDLPIPLPEFERLDKPTEDCSECNGTDICHLCDEGGCRNCEGDGKVNKPFIRVTVGNQVFASKYLTLISDLPNAKLCPSSDGKADSKIKFVFDGGEGRLMPMKSD